MSLDIDDLKTICFVVVSLILCGFINSMWIKYYLKELGQDEYRTISIPPDLTPEKLKRALANHFLYPNFMGIEFDTKGQLVNGVLS